MADTLKNKIKGAVYGMMIGDALSQPVHWFYNPGDIRSRYGYITDFQPAPAKHPSSIMSLSNTGGAGRGRQDSDLVGTVILHGKKAKWGPPNMHYHDGMKAGENTLNALCARMLLRTIVEKGGYTPSDFLAAYVKFMTTPGTIEASYQATADTYAESYHRIFFSNWRAGKPPTSCAGDDGHNIASMGGLVLLPPPIFLAAAAAVAGGDREAAIHAARRAAVTQQMLTHKSEDLGAYSQLYAELLVRVVLGEPLKAVTADIAKSRLGLDLPRLVASAAAKEDTGVVGSGVFSSACYIEHSFPALLYFAHKYADSPEAALQANTNVGGENAHRGAALGAVMGAAHGVDGWPERWRKGLYAAEGIEKEAHAFATLCVATATATASAPASAPAPAVASSM